MKYDFVTKPNRKGLGSSKWEQMYKINSKVQEDVIPLSVADMEFKNPPEIIEGLKKYLDEIVLGYSVSYEGYLNSVVDWQKKRHKFEIKKEWIVATPGVVTAFNAALRTFAEAGNGVILTRPLYYPMLMSVEWSELKEVNVPLLNSGGEYYLDFEGIEKAASDPNNKVLLFCSPHNPTARVWTKEELIRLGDICLKHDVKIISDEIWNDIIMPGYEHTVFANISEKIRDITITCTAPSKTFNIAGLAASNIIIANDEIRKKFLRSLSKMVSLTVNIMGYKACEIAYNECEDWLEELIKVIEENRKLCVDFFESRGCRVTRTQGTYLVWVDCSSWNMDKYQLEKFLQEEAQFFTDEGYIFGTEGEKYERLNIALPTQALKTQLERLDRALLRNNII